MTGGTGVSTRARLRFAETVRQRALPNGARFLVLENHFNPTVSLSGSLHAGGLFAPAGRRLIAGVTAGELQKGTEKRTKLEIAEELESRGASLSFAADVSDPVGLDIGGSALSRDVEMLLDTLTEILRAPSFPDDELEKEKKRLVGAIRQQQDQTAARAYEAASRRIFPPEHPHYRSRGEERIARVEALSREELQSHYEARYGAGTLLLAVVGDVSADEILDGLERRLGDWRRGPDAAVPPVPPPAAAPGEESIFMPDKASADVVMVQPGGLVRKDPDFLACTLANAALGQSSLTSRLGVRVRDVEGLTYGIHSTFSASHIAGAFTVSLSVKPESREAAIASAREEVARFVETGMTAREVKEEKSSRIGRFKVDLAANSGIAEALDAAVYYGFGVDYLDRYPELVERITKEEADAAFARRVSPDSFTTVSAGTL